MGKKMGRVLSNIVYFFSFCRRKRIRNMKIEILKYLIPDKHQTYYYVYNSSELISQTPYPPDVIY
jgi:hypothetical protein